MPVDENGRFVRRRIRSSRAKKDAIPDRTPRTKNVRDIRTWPPGTFILIDTRKEAERTAKFVLAPKLQPFVGLGMVVANDGISQIRVLWGGNCGKAYKEYDVGGLSTLTIFCVE